MAENNNTISKKDRLSLLISSIALLLSLSTFGITRWENYQDEQRSLEVNTYSAFHLGKGFAESYLLYVNTREGDQNEVNRVKAEALTFATQVQAYADALDLRLNLKSLIESYNYKNGVIPVTTNEAIEQRLKNNYPKEVVSTFSLSWWLMWLNFNLHATYEAHPEFVETFKKDYPAVARIINHNLQEVGIQRQISESMIPYDSLNQLKSILDELEEKVTK